VAHSMETTEHRADAIDWIEQHESQWSQANNFRYHIHWHRALIYLEQGDLNTALDLYDRTVLAEDSVEYLDVCNEASMLLRFELSGMDPGDRWVTVANKAAERINDQAMGFADIHYMMALTGSPLAE